MSENGSLLDTNRPLLNDDKFNAFNSTNHGEFQIYSYRWVTLALFVMAAMANAIIMPTWNSITNKADTYWDNIGITFVNLLGIAFQVMGFPGTIIALRVAEKNSLRVVLLCGAGLTILGCSLRFLGALMRDAIGPSGSYALVIMGTSLVGLSQPFIMNMPAKLATVWFPITERDAATSFSLLAVMIGISVGSFLPAVLTQGESDNDIKNGIRNLLMVQFMLVGTSGVILFFLFRSEPPSPPSESAKLGNAKQAYRSNIHKVTSAATDSTRKDNNSDDEDDLERTERTTSISRVMSVDFLGAHKTMWAEVKSLFCNLEYMKLFTSFTLVTGSMHGCLALINQFPDNFGNDQVGYASSAILVSGLIGAFSIGFIMDRTKAYRTIYKVTNMISLVLLIFFLSNCKDDAYTMFIISGILYGFFVIPTFPATIVCAVECVYPVPEEAALGIMSIGMSLMGITVTFVGQVLLQMPSTHHDAPLFPFGYFLITMVVVASIPVLTFKGKYLRLEMDVQTARDSETRNALRQSDLGLSAEDERHVKYAVVATEDDKDDHNEV